MKLFELSGIKSYKNMSGNLIMKMLERTGVFKKILGRGAFGIAFELGDGEVLKVWHKDAGYENYIEYCIAHKGNPYLLKVHGKVQKFEIKKAASGTPVDMKFVRIERLEKPDSMKPFGYNETDATKINRIMSRLTHDLYLKLSENEEDILSNLRADPKKSSPEFIKFVRAMSEICLPLTKKEGVALDLKLENFGLRNGHIVLLDPLVDDNDPIPIKNVLDGFWNGQD